jgi:hypothetical protein
METVVIGHPPQCDKLSELLLLTTTNGILQQLTSVSHGLYVNSFGRQRDRDRAKALITAAVKNVKEKSDGCYS